MAQKDIFISKLGFIAACIGMAVGTGNIWRFPRMAAQYGGGAFVFVYIIALFVWSAPLLMIEMAIGRKTGMAPVGGLRNFAGEKYTWMGGWLVAVCMLITFYYSVVTGWCAKYFILALQGKFHEGVDSGTIWNGFLYNRFENILFQIISTGVCSIIIYRGIRRGVEITNKIMIPGLFFLLIVTAIRGATLENATTGLRYLFIPDWSKLREPATWLQAFTQSAWSTGAGWGLMLTYSAYATKKNDIPPSCFLVGFADNCCALLAGMAVIPTIFALSSDVESAKASLTDNMGLTFISMAGLFPKMKGGLFIAPVFFLSMWIAAMTSLLSMLELGVKTLMDFGFSRAKSTVFVTLICIVCGIVPASFPSFLLNQDWVWGLGLLVSGFFVIITSVKYGIEKIRKDLINDESEMPVGKWLSFIVKYVSPLVFIIVTSWWMSQAIGWDRKKWWHPFETFSVGTILMQWVFLIVIVILINRKLVKWQNVALNKEKRK